ncbi:MAG TPA: zinc ABC transporter substrate-binding protein [Thermoanaerobaculia bacterium]|nr:zinc ABC transporter substrate-binding protein [Thermoanaerobaculia bacterium]
MRRFLPSWLAPLLLLATVACSPPAPAPGVPGGAGGRGVLQVGVTVPPQAYLVERLGGGRVAIEVLMPSGSSEETFSPSPRQMVALSRADLYLLVGHPAFLVESRHVVPALERNRGVRVVGMWVEEGGGQGRDRGEARPNGHGHGDGEAEDDPHLWTAPRAMRRSAVDVAAALSELDPSDAPLYRARLASFLADLDALDAEIRRELSGLPRRRFLVAHPAWGRFASEYGLEQVAIEQEGKEPGPRRLVALLETARAEGMRTVFSQRGFPDAAARAIAGELGARVVPLDPLARNWLDNTRWTARAVAAELGGPAGRPGPAPAPSL